MIEKPQLDDGLFLMIVYALAAISGGLGGCVVWSYYSTKKKRALVFIFAYAIIGCVFGIAAASLAMIYDSWVNTIQEIILYGILSGGAGAIIVFAVNWGAGVAFRWRGLEVKLTLHRPNED